MAVFFFIPFSLYVFVTFVYSAARELSKLLLPQILSTLVAWRLQLITQEALSVNSLKNLQFHTIHKQIQSYVNGFHVVHLYINRINVLFMYKSFLIQFKIYSYIYVDILVIIKKNTGTFKLIIII